MKLLILMNEFTPLSKVLNELFHYNDKDLKGASRSPKESQGTQKHREGDEFHLYLWLSP